MNNIEKQLEISTMAFKNTEELIKSFVNDRHKFKTRMDRNKVTDEFTVAFNGMSMLMSELDRDRAIKMLDDYGILNTIKKSVDRIRTNRSLAFT